MVLNLWLLVVIIFASTASVAAADGCTSWLCSANSVLRGEDAFMALRQQETTLEQEVLNHYSGNHPEIMARLHRYREYVHQNSYRQTLRLCWAYRAAAGMGNTHPSTDAVTYEAGRLSDQIRHTRSNGEVQKYNQADSLLAWSEIYAHGLYQPIDAIVGLKSDYLQVSHLGFFSFQSWFRSMYAMNFVSSTGFLYGAIHCLNTTNSRDLQKFAGAILAVDYEGTLTTEVGSGFVIGKLAALIARPISRWTLRPLQNFFSWLKPKIKKPVLVVAGVPTTVILADNLACKMIQLEASQKALTAEMHHLTESTAEASHRRHLPIRRHKVLGLTRSFLEAKKNCDAVSVSGELHHCSEQYAPFIDLIRRSGFHRELNDYRRDLALAQKDREAAILQSATPRKTRNLYYCTGGLSGDQVPRDKNGALDLQQAYLTMLELLIPMTESLNQNGKLE
ncbi:MAG: hypothetical protein K2Q26_09260 [Bdellovibrionales bacterium]|nr:hypothetical protein [Bdellovibrionales bacterium]